MGKTKIEWTEYVWNPVTGCSVTSPGCTNCYAMKLAGTRLAHHPSRAGLTQDTKVGPVWTGEVRLNEDWLTQPLKWRRPRRIFVCAHGDLFHENVPDEWIDRVFAVMALAPQHTFQVLTKRTGRMRDYMDRACGRIGDQAMALRRTPLCIAKGLGPNGLGPLGHIEPGRQWWPLPNVWLGVSVEDQARADQRIPDLLATPATKRFLSCEPLLGPVDLTMIDITVSETSCVEPSGLILLDALTGVHCDAEDSIEGVFGNPDPRLDWIIVGGESGPGARSMHPEWARSLRDQCQAAGVPFFFKQWGEWAPVSEMPEQHIDACYHPAPEHDPEATRRCKVGQCVLHVDAARFEGEAMFRRPAFEQGSGAMTMFAVGKARAGRLLDGREWNEVPHG